MLWVIHQIAIQSTRKTTAVLPYATVYAEMLVQLLRGGPGSSLKEVAQAAGRQLGVDVAAMVRADGQRIGIGSDPMTAC